MCLQGPLGIQSGPGGGQELLEVRVGGGGGGGAKWLQCRPLNSDEWL